MRSSGPLCPTKPAATCRSRCGPGAKACFYPEEHIPQASETFPVQICPFLYDGWRFVRRQGHAREKIGAFADALAHAADDVRTQRVISNRNDTAQNIVQHGHYRTIGTKRTPRTALRKMILKHRKQA
ncbi:hypothetical protein PAPHI01_2651, partial [Pancytospora philotis]